MTFKLSALLNPAPSSGPSSPKSSSHEARPEMQASPVALSPEITSASAFGNPSTTMNSTYNHQDAANTLAALAQTSPRSYSVPFASPTYDSHAQAQLSRRQSTASILPPLEHLPTVANHHSSSPTLEEYHHGSKSPEQRRQSEVETPSTPVFKLAPLQVSTAVPPTQSRPQVETPGPPNLPLFVPAQVRSDRKPSISAHASQSPKSTSPENMIPPGALEQIDDPDTRAAIEAAANEYGLRGSRKPTEPKTPVESTPTVPKKRPAPKSVAANKKGTAKKAAAPPAKKRKTEADRPRSAGTRSATPVARQPKTGNKGRSSVTPAVESSPASAKQEEDYASEENDVAASDGEADDELFCICRKPDDHKYMIGCDGGCEDWFHGRCVNITEEEGKLIDKYICPNCEKAGIGETTWKPMCRREGCRKAARLTNGAVSKYCSQDCGLLFFSNLIQATDDASNPKSKRKPGQRANKHIKDPDHPASKAGPLTPGQLKALVVDIDDADIFRKLGKGVLNPLTPGLIKSFNTLNLPPADNPDSNTTDPEPFYELTTAEQADLEQISEKKAHLRSVRATLKDRERYISMAKERQAAYLQREKAQAKNVCGYDARLSWSLARFQRWRESSTGSAVFERGSLEMPPAPAAVNGSTGDKEAAVKTEEPVEGLDALEEISFCLRKPCERHKKWKMLQLEDVRFEESGLADQMRQLDRQERDIKERAGMRWRREKSGLLSQQGMVEVLEGTGIELR